jgi:predicted alpha/beta superfamily hydrolase
MLGANQVADVTKGTVDVYPWFFNTQGTLKVFKDVYSPQLNNSRDVIVYMPPSYTENTLKVHKNVLVMHDGNNLFDRETAFMGNSWLVQNTLDPLIYEGQIEEVLVVGAYNTGDRMYEYTYSFDPSEGFGGKGDIYLNWIE